MTKTKSQKKPAKKQPKKARGTSRKGGSELNDNALEAVVGGAKIARSEGASIKRGGVADDSV